MGGPREDAINAILADIVTRRGRGERLDDDAVIAAHPDLAPELAETLASVARIGTLVQWARSGEGTADIAGASAGTLPWIKGYKLIEAIGSGGQATVYRARQTSTGRIVAVKVVHGGLFHHAVNAKRFEREADILASLDHPNIVGVIDRGRTNDLSPFFVMPFVDGASLNEWLSERRSRGDLSAAEIAKLFAKIAGTVQAAHAQGVVHRDLKPANIIIDRHGEPHVLDFGFARRLIGDDEAAERLRRLTLTGNFFGSLPWASPEQLSSESQAASPQTDVYALGVMLYEAVADRFPYPVFGPVSEIIDNIRRAAPAPPSRHVPSLTGADEGLDRIILQALAKKTSLRYSDAGALAADLERFHLGHGVHAPPLPRRRRGVAAVAGALLIVTSLAGVALSLFQSPIPEIPDRMIQLPHVTNSFGMEFARIPKGTCYLGSPVSEAGRSADEVWRVGTVSDDFFIGVAEVTREQFDRVLNHQGTPVSGAEKFPMGDVSWGDATAFCDALSRLEGRRYRLPTEVEWEYACRAGGSTPYGSPRPPLEQAWCAPNSSGKLHLGRQKLPNRWGLYDMHGNASEWCQDLVQFAPPLTLPAQAEIKRRRRIVKGGGVDSLIEDCRSAAREQVPEEIRSPTLGFRVVLEAID